MDDLAPVLNRGINIKTDDLFKSGNRKNKKK
jgi:hypothetical protein